MTSQILIIIISLIYTIELIFRNTAQIIREKKYTQLIAGDNNFFSLYVYILTFAITFILALMTFGNESLEEYPYRLYIVAAVVHFLFIFLYPKTIYFNSEGFRYGYFRLHLIPYDKVTLVDFIPCQLPLDGYMNMTTIHIEVNYKAYKARIRNTDVTRLRNWFSITKK